MGAQPKGLVARREVRKLLPKAYREVASFIRAGAVTGPVVGDAVFSSALQEVVDFLERKAQQLDAGRSGR